MTRPTVIFFGPDGISNVEKKDFIRTLLYSTSESGQYVQNMFVRLQRGESIQNFNVWVYGDTKLVRGSGLFVDKQGVAYNHHFLLPKDGISYDFISGEYILQVFIETVNCQPRKIYEQRLSITKSQEDEIVKGNAGVYFDWAPNTQNYHSHIDIGNKKGKEFPLF
ncbi:MAG: hypothetical protein WCG87_01610 [Bacteroidota bacterium]